jgi:molecular chaperone GrpE (heat shock protein)
MNKTIITRNTDKKEDEVIGKAMKSRKNKIVDDLLTIIQSLDSQLSEARHELDEFFLP